MGTATGKGTRDSGWVSYFLFLIYVLGLPRRVRREVDCSVEFILAISQFLWTPAKEFPERTNQHTVS
jgi:hypothetical protein